ncbi:PIG-L family deacetylase [Aestuariimicrobium ganziense]|uniref:PIG-L family deacetylase n=1 Tax=Aestuariimicrobium ganziense TaxID=2773677 RepID=UPI00194237AD|nr:PIG-L family deacetylase [Aestuariimicrobium ganziense]
MSLLSHVSTVAFVHAHPDDETLATGALIADLTERGIRCPVLTCTRGERGEIVPGVLPEGTTPEALVRHRLDELGGALRTLGTTGPVFLGEGGARAEGREPRIYHDSGMRWVTPNTAGPDTDAPANAFSLASLDEVVTDIAVWLQSVGPDAVVSYDLGGGYGHPDHVRAREATELAVRRLRRESLPDLELYEVIPADRPIAEERGIEWDDLSRHTDQVAEALSHHASQLTVEGTQITHVGGQLDTIATRMGLRRVV